MKGPNALTLTGMLGRRLQTERTGRRDLSALVTVVADLAGWNAAQDFAAALDVDEADIESTYLSWTRDKEHHP